MTETIAALEMLDHITIEVGGPPLESKLFYERAFALGLQLAFGKEAAFSGLRCRQWPACSRFRAPAGRCGGAGYGWPHSSPGVLGMDPRVKPEDDEGEDAKGALPPMR
ncbi:hypothetical protein ACVOMV_38010 [Mesorhizobium atlanticum]